MIKLRQMVIVEGRYDKSRLTSILDADILVTGGFNIFRDKEKLDYIRRIAQVNGIVILTDSDAAGFRIRNYIAGALDSSAKVTHVYIADLYGKERRKTRPGAEGKLGVEGIPCEMLLEAFARAGIVAEDVDAAAEREDWAQPAGEPVTHLDFLEWGLSGGDNSAELRRSVLTRLGLPARMNVKSMLAAVNALYDRESFLELLSQLE